VATRGKVLEVYGQEESETEECYDNQLDESD